ncbi:exodeoxyribonuclease V subunit gamma [Acidithiobacillus sp. AMEEHan]|uniref:exodeoxyribonuclease V subunit gamma n=1 Tax=Acidithiobacillus sp. AMEEHan TaxID=2994951 RepID=UPI0027E56497|nr:exodeoxyribonuclease V subunit gamma [Acidithiobacillus sp. AMEEHan]
MAGSQLTLVHSQRAEDLRDLLVQWCSRHPLPPLRRETILVQSNGVAEWLKLGFAAEGIAAGLDFLLPAQFLWRAYRAVLGREAIPDTSPFDKEQLRWRLFRLLEDLPDPVYAPLRRYLQRDPGGRRRFHLAERVADLYDQYQVYRADWLAAWEEGRDSLPALDGAQRPLPAQQRWQAHLWRALLADLQTSATAGESRGKIHQRFVRRLAGPGPWPELPQRLVVFGISSLPQQTLFALAALAEHLPVLILVLDPCAYYWGDIVTGHDLLRREARGRKRSRPGDDSGAVIEHGHPLLAAWGKTGRDYLAALEATASALRLQVTDERIELFRSGETRTLLQQLQDDILFLRPASESRSLWPPIDLACDDSLRFHVAHGPLRELEVLQDQILESLRLDASLRPRDILVMLPALDGYAARIDAVFGRYSGSDPRHLPYRIVDAPVVRQNSLLHALDLLLGLPQSRLPASMLWDLLEVSALRRRFGMDAEDVLLLRSWLQRAGARWGLDDNQRQNLGLGGKGQVAHTWFFALQRLLLGYAVGHGEACGDWEPSYLPVDSAARLAPFIELLARISYWQTRLQTPATPEEWQGKLEELLADFFLAQGEEEQELLLAQGALQAWVEECAAAGLAVPLSLEILGEAWRAAIDVKATRASAFFSGGLTFATLMPMRAIPFRRIYLLGMNEKDYPRRQIPSEFDLLRSDYRPGDRSRREDDRYLFLEALLSARDALQIFWSGRSPRDDSEEPPSVLVAQLRDHLARIWSARQGSEELRGGGLLAALTTSYPLQAFSQQYLGENASHFTFAREWWEQDSVPASEKLLPLVEPRSLTLRDLQELGKRPARYFLQQGLGVRLRESDAEIAEDSEPFALDTLQQWQIRREFIQALQQETVDAAGAAAVLRRESARQWRRGDLPPGAVGRLLGEELACALERPLQRYLALAERYAEELPLQGLSLQYADTELVGEIDGLRRSADGDHALLRWSASKLGSGKNIEWAKIWPYWIEHLALHAADRIVSTHLLGMDAGDFLLAPVDPAWARAHLAELAELALEARRRPVPMLLPLLTAGDKDDATGQIDLRSVRRLHADLVQQDEELRRVWPQVQMLLTDDAEELTDLRRRFLRPLQDAAENGVRLRKQGDGKA